MKKIGLIGLLLLAISFTACRDGRKAKNYNEKTEVDDDALSFIKAASQSGMVEMKTAELATTKSKNGRVVGFAKMMMNDHSKANHAVMALADKKRVTLPDSVIDVEQRQALTTLTGKSATEFDKAYMTIMVTNHQKAVQMFYDAAQNKNKDVQELAKKNLPILKMHLDSAKAIASSLK